MSASRLWSSSSVSWPRPNRCSRRQISVWPGSARSPTAGSHWSTPTRAPSAKATRRRPTEFGYKAVVADTAEGFVILDLPTRGAPVDGGLLEDPIVKAKSAGMQIRTVYADRGFGTSRADAALAAQSIPDNVIPRQQRPAPVEHTRGWKRRYRFRNGLEGRISQLKRKGLRRTRLRTLGGAQTWVGGIALAHNLQRMALLT